LLSRLDRYLLREVAQTFVAVTVVLLMVLLSNQLARVLGQAAQGGFPASAVARLIGLTTLQQLPLLVPIGLFLGIVLALGRLYHESENDGDRGLRCRHGAHLSPDPAAHRPWSPPGSRC
jgi:lipopolysaccharide export system permease protein